MAVVNRNPFIAVPFADHGYKTAIKALGLPWINYPASHRIERDLPCLHCGLLFVKHGDIVDNSLGRVKKYLGSKVYNSHKFVFG